MKIEDDGNLSLHMADLDPEYRNMVRTPLDIIDLKCFTTEAQIAVWYARQVEARIIFAAPKILCSVDGCGRFGYPGKYKRK